MLPKFWNQQWIYTLQNHGNVLQLKLHILIWRQAILVVFSLKNISQIHIGNPLHERRETYDMHKCFHVFISCLAMHEENGYGLDLDSLQLASLVWLIIVGKSGLNWRDWTFRTYLPSTSNPMVQSSNNQTSGQEYVCQKHFRKGRPPHCMRISRKGVTKLTLLTHVESHNHKHNLKGALFPMTTHPHSQLERKRERARRAKVMLRLSIHLAKMCN